MEQQLGQNLSAELVSNWLRGELLPRPDKMRALAKVLKVDEVWLSLGAIPELSPEQKAERSIHAGGAVNFVAGLVQLGGGTIAFVEPNSLEFAYADFHAIVRGKPYLIKVSFGVLTNSQVKFAIPNEHARIKLIALVKERHDKFQLYEIPSQVVSQHGDKQGGYVDVVASGADGLLRIKKTVLPSITDFESYQL